MPLETRKVPQSEWDQHQHTIRALYHNQKLPLSHQKGGRCVISVMREEHGFIASLSQYEAQLRRWESQKNLKKHEWAFMLAQYDGLVARGCQVRIVSSGLPLSEARIARARRHLQSIRHTLSMSSPPRHAFVEYQDHRGDWIQYSPASLQMSRKRPTEPCSALIPLSSSWDQLPFRTSMRAPGLPREVHTSIESSSLEVTPKEPILSHRRLVAKSTFRLPYTPVGPGADVFLHPLAQQILGTLPSLAPNGAVTSNLGLSARASGNDLPTLVGAIAYSFSNRMATPPKTGHETVFGLLKKSESLRQGLQDLLLAVHPSFRMCFSDNLFRQAVEAGDAQATQMVLEMARDRFAYVIDPNKIRCTLPQKEGQYTALEIASLQRNVELAKILVGIGADPNKSYWIGFCHLQGALEAALWYFKDDEPSYKPPPLSPELVRLLLDHRAKVRPETVRLLLHHPLIESELAGAIMAHVEIEDHLLFFDRQDLPFQMTEDPIYLYRDVLIPDIARIFHNAAAASASIAFFSKCDAEICGPCASRHEDKMTKLLQLAARRGNFDLVEFILPLVPGAPLQNVLVTAIRSREVKLVDYLLEKGAPVDRPASAAISLSGLSHRDEALPFLEEITPLAEAIRCQDDYLIQRLETLGALPCTGVGKRGRFSAAAAAAASTANLEYLRKLFETVPGIDGDCLAGALTAAITRDHDDIVCFLLFSTHVKFDVSSFEAAIHRRNKPIFDLLVEFHAGTECVIDEYSCTGMLICAASWGNDEVLSWLTRLGVNASGISNGIEGIGRGEMSHRTGLTPLVCSVLSGNKDSLRWLLRKGADAASKRPDFVSPLALAVLRADVDMVRLLLAHHAPVRDTLAFVFAVAYSRNILDILLSAFALRFPEGTPGFGRMALLRALQSGNEYEVKQLVRAKFDVNTLSEGYFSHNLRIVERRDYEKTDVFDEVEKVATGEGVEDHIRDRIQEAANVLRCLPQRMSALGYAIHDDSHGNGCDMVRLLLEASGEPNSYASNQPAATPLLLAIEYEQMDLMDLLVERGADVNLPARQGLPYTPLQLSCKLGRLDMVEFLLQRGADVRADPALVAGGTALQMAAQSGNIMIVQLLLDNGADVHEAPSKARGHTAFEGAAKEGRITMLEFLWTQACPAGFSLAELERAKLLADQEGHRGCVEYIDLLLMIVGDARTPRLSAGYE